LRECSLEVRFLFPLVFTVTQVYRPEFNNFSTFAFTLSSILMSGGRARLKPSPGSFFVASMPEAS
jgi:hypothetical protein